MRRVLFSFPLVVSLALANRGSVEAQTYNWHEFSKDFISANYPNGIAIGSLRAKSWAAAANVHPTKCGGQDGELHIGIFNSGLDQQSPAPSVAEGTENDWGIVAELPDANAANGPGVLSQHKTGSVVFHGYFRVWDEGHSVGAVHASNPHHVFEVHPAWGFDVEGGPSFEDRGLVAAMTGYAGYGATKFRPVFDGMDAEEWPLVYQDASSLHVLLIKAENFYQLPVIVREVLPFAGGHEATVDVYSDKAFKHLRHKGLRCLTVEGSEYDTLWKTNDRVFLLGFFSVNLQKALDAVGTASQESDAVPASDALEFFVFGVATKSALVTCN